MTDDVDAETVAENPSLCNDTRMSPKPSAPSSASSNTRSFRFVHYKPRLSARQRRAERLRQLNDETIDINPRIQAKPDVGEQVISSTALCRCIGPCHCHRDYDRLESRCTRMQFVPKDGSGDPFRSLPMMVTKEIHEAIVYWTRSSHWDCVHNYSHGMSSKSYFRLEMEHDVLKLQQSELDAVMFLYQSAAMMAATRSSAALEDRKMRLKRQALSTMRESIEFVELGARQNSWINSLIAATIAALIEGEGQQAEMHGVQMFNLVRSLEAAGDTAALAELTTRMARIFFFDSLFALKRGRPVRMHTGLLPSRMRSFIEAKDIEMSHDFEESEGGNWIDESFSPALIDVFRGWRTCISVYAKPRVDEAAVDPMSAFCFTMARSHRLLNKIVALLRQETSKTRSPHKDPIELQIRNTEVMLAAALLMQLSILQHIVEPIGQVCFSNGTVHILRDLLHPTIVNNRQPRFLQEAQLWALYASACWEITYLPNAADRWQPWFVQALRRKSSAMGIQAWAEADKIFDQYWPSKLMAPDGSEWFEDLLSEGSLRPQLRGLRRECCWGAACALDPKNRRVQT